MALSVCYRLVRLKFPLVTFSFRISFTWRLIEVDSFQHLQRQQPYGVRACLWKTFAKAKFSIKPLIISLDISEISRIGILLIMKWPFVFGTQKNFGNEYRKEKWNFPLHEAAIERSTRFWIWDYFCWVLLNQKTLRFGCLVWLCCGIYLLFFGILTFICVWHD